MEEQNNLPQQNKEKAIYFPALLNSKLQEIETISEKEYLAILSKGETPQQVSTLLMSMANDTHKTCIERCYDGTPNIKQLSQTNPVAYTRVVKMMLFHMNLAFNVKEGLRKEQLNVIPTLLLTEFSFLTLNDISLICRLIMTAKFKIYERIDIDTFFRCVREYDGSDERITARETYHRNKNTNKHEAAKEFKALPEEIKDQFTKPKDKIIPLRLNEVPPMLFKVTDKESMKKLKGERND